MAVFGFNLTVSILGLFFLRKLIPALDFPSKLLTGFYRFFAPSENECRQAAQLKPKTVKGSKKNQNAQSKEFVIPKVWVYFYFTFSNDFIQDAEVPLYFAQVKPDDWSFLHFYPEFCWLVEFSITTLFVLAVTEAVPRYFFLSLSFKLTALCSEFKWRGDSVPDEVNLSVIWIILACLFCSINLARLSSKLIRSTGERSLVSNLIKMSKLTLYILARHVWYFHIRLELERSNALIGLDWAWLPRTGRQSRANVQAWSHTHHLPLLRLFRICLFLLWIQSCANEPRCSTKRKMNHYR